MAQWTASSQTHIPILLSQSSPAENVRALSMVPETCPSCTAGQFPDVGVRQIGRVSPSHVQRQSVETQVVPNFRDKFSRDRGQQPRMPPPSVRKVGAQKFDAGKEHDGRRAFPAEADVAEVDAVPERSVAALEEIGFVGRAGASER